MNESNRGYSAKFAADVRDTSLLPDVKAYALHCFTHDIGAKEVAQMFGVSRSSVYLWFRGRCAPRERHVAKMRSIVAGGKTPA